jgi:hypothetical protein
MRAEMRKSTDKASKNMKKAILSLFIVISFFTCALQTGDFLSPQTAFAAQKDQCVWTDIEKIVVIGDLHGDYENFVDILKGTGLVDDDLHWAAGDTHFVQTGDILDRGHFAKDILDLILSLEKEAEAAGGKVHLLLGNHEEMNIVNTAFQQLGYVPLSQFKDFLPRKFRENTEKKIRSNFQKNNSEANSNITAEEAIDNYWTKYMEEQKKEAGQKYFYGFIDAYGSWLLEHNIVIKINDTIFVHGGINEEFSKWPLKKINTQARKELRQYKDYARFQIRPTIIPPEIVNNGEGPFWFRGFALNDEEDFKKEVKSILKNLDAKHMVIAHTPRRNVINSRFDDKIWMIDTGISEVYQGRKTALIIDKGKFIPKEYQ